MSIDEKRKLRILDQRKPKDLSVKKHIHDIVLEHGWVTAQSLEKARESLSQFPGKSLGQVLFEKALIPEEKYYMAVAERNGNPYSDIRDLELDISFVKSISEHLIKKYRIIPVGREGSHLVIVTYDPERPALYTALKSNGFMFVKTIIVKASQVEDFLEKRVFREGNLLEDVSIESIVQQADIQFKAYDYSTGELLDKSDVQDVHTDEQAAIINLVNKTLLMAVKKRASDIHVEPEENEVYIRYRIDGTLRQEVVLEPHIYKAMLIRLKIVGNLDITERSIPQDGAFKLQIDKEAIDFRIAVIPSLYGEAVVVRILSSAKVSADLISLGILHEHIPLIEEKIKSAHGMVLVSGATGSGKSTTLHSFLTIVNNSEKKIITIEDPVENRITGILQIPVTVNRVDPAKSLTFAAALRSILRLDPDIIMVGEIRDGETAQISLTAALTGHLVLSSIHANTAVRVIYRLLELGCDKSALVSTLRVIIAQTLVRLTCKSCRKPVELNAQHMRMMDLPDDYSSMCEIYKGIGCGRCNGTGYLDRIGLFEVLDFQKDISQMVLEDKNVEEIEAFLLEHGYLTILDQCRIKVVEGLISMEEYLTIKLSS
ncbi:GspE/PulE family protein [Candidatus Riflebacteria bacterium]